MHGGRGGQQRLSLLSDGWCTLSREHGFTPAGVLFDNQIRFLHALENKVPLDDDAPFVLWVVPGDSPRILVYIEFTALVICLLVLAVYAPWGEGPHGLLSPRVVTSQASLLKEVAQHLVEMRLELRYCDDLTPRNPLYADVPMCRDAVGAPIPFKETGTTQPKHGAIPSLLGKAGALDVR
ncbi:hypothetical protein EDD18DRAFT_1107587 [Armillaria luteobubalina]|uniref:Uncharacterized protein n=1 Tax=Armillaria luteobubalina TaxID=153913 RepID=A0AA39Q2B0_9AGAR|nr:hypothetical protein EDD18DRAFT_1107587 [Armillaria luteobubalina]